MDANLHIRWLLPIAAAGMSSRDLQVTRCEYMCVCNVCRSVTGPLLLWGLSHVSFWAPPSHSQVPKQCPAQGKSPKSSCWVHRLWTVAKVRGWHTAFPHDYFWSRDFFFSIQSVSTYVSSDSSDSFFFPLFLIKIYTQNFRLHYF